MAEASPEARETARKAQSIVFQRLQSVGQVRVAEALGVSEPTVSRMKNDDLPPVLLMLAVIGIKCVPITARCYAPETIEPLLALAKQRMAQLENISQLEWDE